MSQVIGYAVVDTAGALLHSSGVQQVDHIGEGTFHITFDTNVADACQIASIGDAGAQGWVSAYGGVVGPKVIEVVTGTYENGHAARKNRTFQLLLVK
ncbi:hypothetical protein [Ktedonobacter racemifer]|uniref:Uncharacterized protein n=1 Tax=Ktedonobacter racemifer DSM 44963 TaxID=485913 RepID=D6TKU2_KTERA|nr:hypothetical protein [Ktedonobacter racemifer]EFH86392.1 hypothetical protein Krac_7687 [Ktedonobacter racemifer DSM 44963]